MNPSPTLRVNSICMAQLTLQCVTVGAMVFANAARARSSGTAWLRWVCYRTFHIRPAQYGCCDDGVLPYSVVDPCGCTDDGRNPTLQYDSTAGWSGSLNVNGFRVAWARPSLLLLLLRCAANL